MKRLPKLLKYSFIPEGEYLEVVGISDLHYGSAQFLPKKAHKHRAYIMQDPVNRKVIDLGDSIENALKSSPGSSFFQQTCPPSEQREWVREFYRPIKEQFLGVVASNHPGRTEKEADWDADEPLVAFLDCPWIRWEAVLAITVGDSRRGQNYTIHVRHAITNSSKPAVVLSAMMNQRAVVQGCDAYWYAHNHMYLYQPVPTKVPDPRHGKLRKFDQHFVMGDAFIQRDDGYGESRNFPEPTAGQVSLRLYRDEHRVEVSRLLY